jgi:hypothetical protein
MMLSREANGLYQAPHSGENADYHLPPETQASARTEEDLRSCHNRERGWFSLAPPTSASVVQQAINYNTTSQSAFLKIIRVKSH